MPSRILKTPLLVILFTVIFIKTAYNQRGDDVKTFQRIIKDTATGKHGNFVIKYPQRKSSLRVQPYFPKSIPFPCTNITKNGFGRSPTVPTSIHKLRPGDIDIIGALGDSLVAGNGALEEYAFGTIIEHRGVSWCAGGEGTWREFLTLPNILKEFNPNLKGFSLGEGEFLSSNSKLNVAFPVAADADALRQAKILVKKIRDNPDMDINNNWKMVTIFFGANDLCSAQCYDKEAATAASHVRKLERALDYLQNNLPRTFVNLIPVLDVSVSLRIKRTLSCRFLHRLFCECFHRGGDEFNVITSLTKAYQQAEEVLISSGKYDKKSDFTVVLQPFMKLFNAPEDPSHRFDEVIDISYITHDCFHFSQKGHALAANMLWNNLLEPVGNKSSKKLEYILQKFRCPQINAPYIFTKLNSKNFLETGRQ
ncbi:phospholipase B1, membrane-associated-like [Diorhabda sublineata]|uniref:phospholipase B1, membrane-associated-like n=1 Tax=Diorhabda sublineata TaxID=1163346 RepID=UPI0024E05EEA|nr:phospholipase B1, membrane-associated-like [Diorhabda sublineata]XP_056640516.1 phospholipase B1, membrane-associated-like [Diorhabda sublineata]